MQWTTWLAAVMVAAPVATTVPAAPLTQAAPVTRTAMGSYVQGSPRARVKLVEYLSYTCPHCGHYVVESAAAIAPKVASGQVSIELRHATRDPVDLTAALLARCGGAARIFGNTEAIMRAQPQWLQRAGDWLDGNQAAFQAMATPKRITTLADVSGLNTLMRGRGYTQPQLNQCLGDAREQQLLAAMAQTSWKAIKATPSFTVNGQLAADVHSWAALQPRLTAAGMR